MSKIAYDPVKDQFARMIRNSSKFRTLFYFLLDLFFLRSWHIRRILLKKGGELEHRGPWKLLDAGCGFGQYDRFILKQFRNVTVDAIDLKEDYLDDNRRYFQEEVEDGRIRFYKENLLEVDKTEEFDLVLCIDVLEHIEDDTRVIRNLANSLRQGGFLLMHSPSHYSEEDASGEDTFVGEHARTGYSKAGIEKKLMEADLLPVTTHYTYGKWGRRAWIWSVKWPMLLFNTIGTSAALVLLLYYPVVMPFCLLMNVADLYTKNRTGHGIYALAKKI